MVAQEYANIDPRVQGLQRGANQTAMDATSRYGPALSRVQQALLQGVQRQGAQVQGQLGRQSQMAGMQAGMQEQGVQQQMGAQAYDSAIQRDSDIQDALSGRFWRQNDLAQLEGNANTAQSRAIGQNIIRLASTAIGAAYGSADSGSKFGEMGANAWGSGNY